MNSNSETIRKITEIFQGILDEVMESNKLQKYKDSIMEKLNQKTSEICSLIEAGETKTIVFEGKLVDPKAPKKPKNGYLLFCAKKRESLVEKMTEEKGVKPSMGDVSKALGKLWSEAKEKNSKTYKKFQEEAKKLKDEYDEKMKDYVRPPQTELLQLKENVKKMNKKPRKKSTTPKKVRDPKQPVKPKNVYILFSQKRRKELKEQGDLDSDEIKAQIKKDYEEFKSDPESKAYKKLQKQYEKEKAIYDIAYANYIKEKANESKEDGEEKDEEDEEDEDEEVTPKKSTPVKSTPKKEEGSDDDDLTPKKSEKSKKSKKIKEVEDSSDSDSD
jgi:structure-specific recognition protein 1